MWWENKDSGSRFVMFAAHHLEGGITPNTSEVFGWKPSCVTPHPLNSGGLKEGQEPIRNKISIAEYKLHLTFVKINSRIYKIIFRT